MEEKKLTNVTLAWVVAKCEHYDSSYCKNKNNCPKIHPNINCKKIVNTKESVRNGTKFPAKIVQHAHGSLVNFSTKSTRKILKTD